MYEVVQANVITDALELTYPLKSQGNADVIQNADLSLYVIFQNKDESKISMSKVFLTR